MKSKYLIKTNRVIKMKLNDCMTEWLNVHNSSLRSNIYKFIHTFVYILLLTTAASAQTLMII
jgi:hypothetical protein